MLLLGDNDRTVVHCRRRLAPARATRQARRNSYASPPWRPTARVPDIRADVSDRLVVEEVDAGRRATVLATSVNCHRIGNAAQIPLIGSGVKSFAEVLNLPNLARK